MAYCALHKIPFSDLENCPHCIPAEPKAEPIEVQEELCTTCDLPIKKRRGYEQSPKDLAVWIHNGTGKECCQGLYACARPWLNPYPNPRQAQLNSDPVELVTNCNQLPKEAEGGGVEQLGHEEAVPEAAGPAVRVTPYAVRVNSEFAHKIERRLGATDWSWPAKTQICEEIIAEYLKVAEPATEGSFEEWWDLRYASSFEVMPGIMQLGFKDIAHAAWNAARGEK